MKLGFAIAVGMVTFVLVLGMTLGIIKYVTPEQTTGALQNGAQSGFPQGPLQNGAQSGYPANGASGLPAPQIGNVTPLPLPQTSAGSPPNSRGFNTPPNSTIGNTPPNSSLGNTRPPTTEQK